MEEIFKVYGSAIGPTIAFCFGIFAVYIKYKVDSFLDKRRTQRDLIKLKELIEQSGPPKTFHPNVSNEGLMHADEARNVSNLARFYNRLLGVAPLIKHLEENVYNHCSLDEIRLFNNINWWFSILLKDVEETRKKGKLSKSDFLAITMTYESLADTLKDPQHMFEYSET